MAFLCTVVHWAALGCGVVLAFRYFRALGDVTQAVFNVQRAELISAAEDEGRTLALIAGCAAASVMTHIAGAGDGWVVIGALALMILCTAFPWLWVHVGLRGQQTSARYFDVQVAASALADDDEVLVVEAAGQTWAFADREIRRPHVAGVGAGNGAGTGAGVGLNHRVVMTYCALSRLGMAVEVPESADLSVAGQFGNNLILKMDGACLQQIYAGTPACTSGLRRVAVIRMSWRCYRSTHPDGLVYLNPMGLWSRNPLLRLVDEVVERAFDRALDTHHRTDALMFETLSNEDDRLSRKTLVWGITEGDEAAAFTPAYVQSQGVVNTEVGGLSVALTFDEDAGCLAAFERPAGVQIRQLDCHGRSDVGLLQRIRTLYPGMYWFAWVNFFPGTALNETTSDVQPAAAAVG